MPATKKAQKLWGTLSPREKQAALLMVKGASREESAAKMDCRPKTFDHHRGEVLIKLGVENSVKLVWFCLKNGFIDEKGKPLA